jgi:SAM-dependent methyltransferase
MSFLKIFSRPAKKKEEDRGKFFEMVSFVEERELRTRLPELAGQKALEISPQHRPLTSLLKEKGAKSVARLGGLKEKETPGAKEETFILSHWEHLPFLDNSWDFVLLRAAFLKGGLGRILRESSRILKRQGLVMVCDLHPFSRRVQEEHLKNPVGEEGVGPGFERYFRFYRDSGLRLHAVKELFYEGSLKKFFVSKEEQKEFDQLRRTPFLIFFLLKKE